MPVERDLPAEFPFYFSLFPFSARRFTLGERLESGPLAVLEECVDAACNKHNRAQLHLHTGSGRALRHTAYGVRSHNVNVKVLSQ